MSRFFIDRPIFAWVLAIIVMLAGALSITTLSISQYPQIAPTTIRITANYPGADAETVENSVTKIIEQGMTALDNLSYITSNSTSTGQASITLTFDTRPMRTWRRCRCKTVCSSCRGRLPDAVQNSGLTVANPALASS